MQTAFAANVALHAVFLEQVSMTGLPIVVMHLRGLRAGCADCLAAADVWHA